jgi:hypothetical protein
MPGVDLSPTWPNRRETEIVARAIAASNARAEMRRLYSNDGLHR